MNPSFRPDRPRFSLWRGRNLIGLSCLLAFTAAAMVVQAQSAAPAVSSITFNGSPARGETYELGEAVEVEVKFDRAVTPTGSPQVALTIGTQTRQATLVRGGGQSLYFIYTVQERDRDEDGISIAANALVLNGGTINAADGTTDADLAHEAVSAERGSQVNGSLITPPGVKRIFFDSPARGYPYERGESVEVIVEFDRAVTVTGSPRVALIIGTRTRQAASIGWGYGYGFFRYAVQQEDRDEDGISIPANALRLNGGTIKHAGDGTTDADLTHDAVNADAARTVNGSLATPPAVEGVAFVSSPARSDTYELGETVEVEVEFDRGVTPTNNSPQLALTIGTQTRHATLSRWSGVSLYFDYAVQEGDRDEDGISIAANALGLNGGSIKGGDGTTDAELAHEAVASERGSKVNGSLIRPPRVTRIFFHSFPARGDTYELGETVDVKVEFDRAVTATGSPQLALTIGTQTRHATSSGWSSRSLYFDYTVQEGDRDEDGISIAANALVLNGGTIKATDGATDADLRHAAVAAGRGSKVNGRLATPPTVRDVAFVSSPARDGTYEFGETIEVEVEFDKGVTATGSPQVALTIGTETRHATLSAWGDQSLYFDYAVQEGDRDEDGISIAANALVLNGGTIKATDGATDADLRHAAVAAGRGSKVNGRLATPPAVRDIAFVSSPARDGTYELGETIEVEVEFDKGVTATGSPQVALTIGTETRRATFSAWGSHSLYFDYTVQEADRDEDGISIAANALVLNGGTIRATDGTTDADLSHGAVAAGRGSKVNGRLATPPAVRDIALISSPARDDTYELGETIEVRVEFDRAVTATGNPQVALTIGTETRHAAFSGWGSQTLYFDYTVQAGDLDEDGISIAANAPDLNGGTIRATDGMTDADLTRDAVAAEPAHKVNGSLVTRPTVGAIYLDNHVPPPSGDTYERGERVRVWVEFDREVLVTGSPQVALAIGGQTQHAAFSGFASATEEHVLSFDYFVQATDRDEDGVSIPPSALVLNGGTIRATDGTTDADLTHAAVAADPGRKVDGSLVTHPAVKRVSLYSPTRGDTYERGATIWVAVEFDRAVTVAGRPQLALTVGKQSRTAAFVEVWGHLYAFFSYQVQEADRDEDGISIAANALDLNGGTIRHAGDATVDADLTHVAVAADPGRKVNGSLVTP